MATGALRAEMTSGSGERAPTGVWLRRYAWFVVVYSVLVVLWGVVVRATGSGNGCGAALIGHARLIVLRRRPMCRKMRLFPPAVARILALHSSPFKIILAFV